MGSTAAGLYAMVITVVGTAFYMALSVKVTGADASDYWEVMIGK